MELYIWLGVTVLALIIEFTTSEMLSIWFAGGGIIALILSAIGLSWYIQVPVFVVVSFLSMLLFRKYVLEKLSKIDVKTNADSAFNKEYVLLTKISFNKPGTIKVNGVVWNVITGNPNDEVEDGSIVIVKEIKGNKYIVEVKQ